jgi:hypothetical protein
VSALISHHPNVFFFFFLFLFSKTFAKKMLA